MGESSQGGLRKLVWIAAIFFVFVGAGGLIIGANNLYRTKAAEKWPSVNGEVLTSSVKIIEYDGGSSNNDKSYEVDLTYRYQVGKKELIGHRFYFGQHTNRSLEAVERMAARYSKGTIVTVYYQPDNPEESALIFGIGEDVWVPLVVGGMFFFAGVFFILIGLTLKMDQEAKR